MGFMFSLSFLPHFMFSLLLQRIKMYRRLEKIFYTKQAKQASKQTSRKKEFYSRSSTLVWGDKRERNIVLS